MSYTDYLKSPHWQSVRSRKFFFNRLGKSVKCSICDSISGLQIHHLTYINIGNENSKTLRIICENCHQILHTLPKLKGKGQIIKKWLRLRKQVLKLRKANLELALSIKKDLFQ